MPTLTSPEQSSCIKTMLRSSVEIQVPVPGYMAWLSYMNSCSWCHGVQKDLGCTVTVQLGLCFKMKYHQRRSAPHPSCYGIDFLRTTGPCCLMLTIIPEMTCYSCFLLKLAHCMEENSRVLGEVKEAKISIGSIAL